MPTLQTAKLNGIDTEAVRQTIDAINRDPAQGIAKFQVTSNWKGGAKTETRVEQWSLGGKIRPRNFAINCDEPHELFGTNTAPNPQEVLMAGMNACIMATYVAVSSLMGIELDRVQIQTEGELDLRGFLGLDQNVKPGYDEIRYTVRIKGNGTPQQFQKVHETVMATSPNYWNIANPVQLTPKLIVE